MELSTPLDLAIKSILPWLEAGTCSDGASTKDLAAPFTSALKAIEENRWPAYRYDNDVLTRLGLSEGQQVTWKRADMMPGDVPASEPAQIVAAMERVRELVLAIECSAEMPRLQRRYNKLFAAVKTAPKHGKKWRTLSALLRPLRDDLNLAVMKQDVEAWRQLTSAQFISSAPKLELGLQAARHKKLRCAEQIAKALELRPTVVPKPSEYVLDEDTPEALILSMTGGCAAYDRERRWCCASNLVNPNEKMLRFFAGSTWHSRCLAHIWGLETDKYTGPALVLNSIHELQYTKGRKDLIIKHALKKAADMHIALTSADAHLLPQPTALRGKFRVPDSVSGWVFTNYWLIPSYQHCLTHFHNNEIKFESLGFILP